MSSQFQSETARKDRTLYISDLDGTLLHENGKISDATRAMINDAVRRGTLFSIATARTPATVSSLLKGMDIRLPMVVMTGAALWDMKRNVYSDIKFIKPVTASRLIDIYKEEKLPTFIYTLGDDHIIEIYHLGPMNDIARGFMEERIDNPFKRFRVNVEGTSETCPPLDRILLFLTMQPDEPALRVYERVRELGGCRPIYYHDMYGDEIAELEVFADDASKAEGVRKIAGIAGADRVVAFGDNVNDLPMLRAADLSVGVANAVTEVRDTVSELIGPNSEDSVARYILDRSKES